MDIIKQARKNKFAMKNIYRFRILFVISTFTHTEELNLVQYSDIVLISQIASNQKIQTELQKLLKCAYQEFQSNFENYSVPYLKQMRLCIMKVGLHSV